RPHVDAQAFEQRRERTQPPRMIVVAGEHDAGDPLRQQASQEVEDDLLGLRRRGRGVEHVPCNEDGVHPLRDRDPRHLLERGRVLVHPRAAAERLADVPVRGVKEAHQASRKPRKTSSSAPAGPRASLLRVAQAGNGKRTRSGVGISGCWTIIVPGFRTPARPRPAALRKPYSGRSASAMSSRPTTRSAALATIRGSTSLAVCCAPTSTMPRLRPRSEMSSRTSLIGPDPSRGAYLLSSSSTTNTSGRDVPSPSFSS